MEQNITGRTGFLCVLGKPVRHSLSPSMHNEGFRQLGLDYVYIALEIDEEGLEKCVEGLKLMGCRGWNLTMPNKNKMVSLCDRLSPEAEIAGAVNTVVNDGGILTGYTTDGIGYLQSAREAGFEPAGKVMTILGAGGAATAIIVQAAFDGMKEIRIFNRRGGSWDRAAEIAGKLNERTACRVTLTDMADTQALKASIAASDLLLNATNVGMAPDTQGCLIKDPSWLRPKLWVSDVIYNPEETKLLKMAREAGCKTFNGLYMLLYQGAAAFKLWTGKEMPVDIIKEKYFKR